MSLILDALNKSEQERQSETRSPGLPPVHPAPPLENEHNLGMWAIAAVLILLAVAVVVVVLWLDRTGPAALSEPEPVVLSEPEPVVLSEPALKPISRFNTRSVASLYQREFAAAVMSEPELAQPGLQTGQVTHAGVSPPKDDATSQPGPDIEALAQVAQPALLDAQGSEHSAPLIGELHQSLRDQIPTLFYRKHDWSSNPSDSRVNVNGNSYRAGERLAPGLTLLDILPDYILLDYQGQAFRLSALNSWVNL